MQVRKAYSERESAANSILDLTFRYPENLLMAIAMRYRYQDQNVDHYLKRFLLTGHAMLSFLGKSCMNWQ